MSFHSQDFGFNPRPKQLKSWIGDSALLFVTRLVLAEKYPFLPIKYLMSRERRITENYSLNSYCKRHGLKFGCNWFEIKIYELLITNDLSKAKEIILDIIKHDKTIEMMDKQQVLDDKINPKFEKEIIEGNKKKAAIREEHQKIKNSDLHWTEKIELHRNLKLTSQ